MPLAKLSSKSQIVIPAQMRKHLDLEPGQLLEIVEEEDHIVVRKAPISFVDELDRHASDLWQGYERDLDEAREQW